MPSQASFTGYSHAPGLRGFLRLFTVKFSGSYTIDNGEVVDLTAALNPSGLEDAAVPVEALPEGAPLVLGSNLNGWKPELQLNPANPGKWGITFWNGDTQLTAVAYSTVFPANGAAYGQIILGLVTEG